ncbi:MAG: methylamine utilization protein [Herminiimonas sp.]|nr:methylamine utilization protein [Herminiimonas sp.]
MRHFPRHYCAVFLLSAALSPSFAASINAVAVDKSGAEMADVIIYATPLAGTVPPPVKAEAAVISQQGLQFSPYVTALRVGTEIKFPNNDKIEHHVKSFSAAKEFEIKIYERGTPPPVLFDKPGVVVVYCLLHGWMRAYVMVLDTPYFAKSGVAGAASIDNLPEGSYELKAWHPDMGIIKLPLVQTVKAGDKSAPPVKFAFDFIPKKRKDAAKG